MAMAIIGAGGGLYAYAPYCGAPPGPASLLFRWNLDPLLLAALAAALVAYAVLGRRAPLPPWRRAFFYAGWALGAAALISPLCALSVSLFSARVGQHMILEMIVAPLVVLGWPAPRPRGALAAATAFAAALWFWHAPGPYTATFESGLAYWLMHATTFGAALWLWAALFGASAGRLGARLAAALVTTLQMGFLGAVITFAARPVYAVHGLTTAAWGLTPLEDQQLGAILMWIPAGAVLLAAILAATAAAIRRSEASHPARA